jgi:hypothetical protein
VAEIQYCDEIPDQEWDYVSDSQICHIRASQKDVDDWIEQADARWYPEALEAAKLEESETVESRFIRNARVWHEETEHLSSPSQIMMHPSYQAIMGLAVGNENELIRLMLKDMRENRRLWFWALSYLTKDNPIKQSDAGKMDKMIAAWSDWGRKRGLL